MTQADTSQFGTPIRPRSLWWVPLAATLFVMLGTLTMYHAFVRPASQPFGLPIKAGFSDPSAFASVPTSEANRADRIAEYRARLAWVSCTGLYFTSFFSAVAFLVYALARCRDDLRDFFARRPLHRLTLPLGFIVLIAAVVAVADFRALTAPLIEKTVELSLPNALAQIAWMDRAGHGLALCFSIVVGALLLPPAGVQSASPEARAACLARQGQLLRLALYFGTAALIADTIQHNAMLAWAQTFVDSPADKPTPTMSALNSLVTAYGAVRGLYSSVLLAAIYAPAAFVLHERALALAREKAREIASAPVVSEAPKAEAEKPDDKASAKPSLDLSTAKGQHEWLQNAGLTPTTPIQWLKPLMALIGPLIVGPGFELLKAFLGLIPGAT